MVRLWMVATSLLVIAVSWLIVRMDFLWCSARSLPLGTFWRKPGFAIEDMPNMGGKIVLVTGANTGIGFEVARQFALANATVYMACRNISSCALAADDINRQVLFQRKIGSSLSIHLDLASLEKVNETAEQLLDELPALDVLVNNAGVATQFPPRTTKDGIEETFQVNYLGHFLFTKRLIPLLKKSPQARIVHLTSGAHRKAPPEGVHTSINGMNDPTIGPYVRYGMAKLASLVFSTEWNRRHPDVPSFAVHPGVVSTNMIRQETLQAMLGDVLGSVVFMLARTRNAIFAYSVETAALTVLFCSTSAQAATNANGADMYVPIAERVPARHSKASDAEFATQLWEFSEKLVSTLPDSKRRDNT